MGSYKRKINKMVWSYSRLTAFEQCKYSFYLTYILDDSDEYLSEGNFYSESGSFVHEILAKIFSGEMSVDDAAEYFVDNYDNNVCYQVRKSTMDSTFEKCANYFAEADFSWINDYEILGVEKKMNFKVGEYNFIGFIDLLLRRKSDNRIVIIDHKSSEYPFKKNGELKKKSESSFNDYERQMYLYAHAVNELYGEYPAELTWNHFKDGGQFATIPFVEDRCKAVLDWTVDTIHAIENEKDWLENQDFFFCHNICNFRRSCEYNE